jgi:Ti-type conjugative transfer relaxase TraA
MAIFHQTTKMVKRSDGRNAVAAAAYRAGIALYEEATGKTHDYSKKMGVEHSEILAPDHAPEWVFDRQKLWNMVEAAENRRDSQVAREVEVGLPIELSKAQQIELLREFVKREFVARGMVADFSLHLDNPENPHAHILLTTRGISDDGFGLKMRDWNQTAELEGWRRGWAEVTNEHLAAAGLGVRIDHRSYAEQQLELIPGRKIGLGLERREDEQLPGFLADRVAEQKRIMGANGEQILAEPGIALKALTHGQATFTHHDIARFLNPRTDGAEQFEHAYLKVTTSPELVDLGTDEEGRQRFTTRGMVELERGMLADAGILAERGGHRVRGQHRSAVLSARRLSDEQRQAFEYVTGAGDLKSLVGVAGSGKSTTLAAMRAAWEAEGFTVKGATLSGIAAQNLEQAAGIGARTLASFELAWSGGRDPLTAKDVLVIDEAGMLGTRQLQGVLEVARQAHAKVVLVGDPEQLQAIEAGAAFRGIAAQHGVVELAQVRWQRLEWQRAATAELASGKTKDALAAYGEHQGIVAVDERAQARTALLARWAHDAKLEPEGSQLVLAYTRADVKELNTSIRTLRQQTGQLGETQEIATSQGRKAFSVRDRVRFMRNERSMGVRNGSLGTVEGIEGGVLSIRLDGAETTLKVDSKFYSHLDHGYAATVHKAQGMTVDRTYVLATPHFDRHTAYVALSRHREAATVWYAREDFGGRDQRLDADQVHARFTERLARQQSKDLAHDYLERAAGAGERAVADGAPQTLEEVRRQAREDWGKLRAETAPERAPTPTAARSLAPGMELEPDAPGTPPKPSIAAESEPIVAEGRAAKPEVAQALERERLQAQERDAQLQKQRAALERWRARGRGSSPDPLKERSGEVFEGAIEKAQGPAAQPGPKPAPVIEVAPVEEPASPTPVFETSDQVRAAAREDWREERAGALGSWQAPNLADLRRQGLEEWLAMRAQVQARGGDLSAEQIQAQGRAAWKALRGLEGETAQDLKEEARERERLGALSARELWAQIERIKPLPVERLVELDPAVAGVRRVVETHQFAAQDALHAASRAAHESQWWRRERGLQAKLHDLGVRKAEYLVEREAAEAQAKDARAEALKASAQAQARLLEARSDAERRITQETAPARAKVAELERLAAAAYERERVVQEFERLARGRAAGREEFRDTGESWQATPPKLRQMIDRYNQEPAQVQEAILKKYSTTAALAQSIEENLKLRREQVHALGLGRGHGLR